MKQTLIVPALIGVALADTLEHPQVEAARNTSLPPNFWGLYDMYSGALLGGYNAFSLAARDGDCFSRFHDFAFSTFAV